MHGGAAPLPNKGEKGEKTMRMSRGQVARALAQARLKAAEDRLREKLENPNTEDNEKIAEQVKNMEAVLKAMSISRNNQGGDIA